MLFVFFVLFFLPPPPPWAPQTWGGSGPIKETRWETCWEPWGIRSASITIIRFMQNYLQLFMFLTFFCFVFCIYITEASLPRAPTRGAGDSWWAARRLRRVLHITVSTVTDAHTRCAANLCPWKTVSPLLPTPQCQIAFTRLCTPHFMCRAK